MLESRLHRLQSAKWTFLFIKITVLAAYLTVFGAERGDTLSIKTASTITFGAHLSSTYHYPVKHAAENWKPFFTTGIHGDFPTYIPKLLVHFSIELGSIESEGSVDKDIKIAYWTCSASYDFHVIPNTFILRPHVGLSNSMINDRPFTITDPFSTLKDTENEHGFSGIIEPMYLIKKFVISLPISADIMFSSPEKFITGNIALTIGYNF